MINPGLIVRFKYQLFEHKIKMKLDNLIVICTDVKCILLLISNVLLEIYNNYYTEYYEYILIHVNFDIQYK